MACRNPHPGMKRLRWIGMCGRKYFIILTCNRHHFFQLTLKVISFSKLYTCKSDQFLFYAFVYSETYLMFVMRSSLH